MAFCILRQMLVNIVVCVTGRRRHHLVYILGWQRVYYSGNLWLLSDVEGTLISLKHMENNQLRLWYPTGSYS